jgi:hypothetical protein
LEGPEQPCLTKYEPTVEQALACRAVQENTRIALVNFDFTPEEAQQIAANIKVPFDKSTHAVYNANLVVIPATEAAKAEAAKRNPDCVDTFMDFASIAAQATMPKDLSGDKVDMVIALTKESACDPRLLGLAEGGRYADILAAPGPAGPVDLKTIGWAAAHEAGHLAQLGHASDMLCQTGPSDHMAGPETFDLAPYLQGCELVEYGNNSQSVMGSLGRYDEVPFKAALPQIPATMWPQKKLEGPQVDLAVEATPSGVSLGADDARADKFISVSLEASPIDSLDELTIKDADNEVVVDSVAIVPAVDEANRAGSTYEPYIWGGTLQFHTVGNGVVDAGYIEGVSPGESGTWTMRAGEKLITITLAGGRLAVAAS